MGHRVVEIHYLFIVLFSPAQTPRTSQDLNNTDSSSGGPGPQISNSEELEVFHKVKETDSKSMWEILI